MAKLSENKSKDNINFNENDLILDGEIIGTYNNSLQDIVIMYIRAYAFMSKQKFDKLNFLTRTKNKQFDFKVYLVHKEKQTNRGDIIRMIFNERTIHTYLFLIRNDLTDVERNAIIIHEMFHMFYYMSSDKVVSDKVVEKVTNYNAYLFIARFYHNFELIKQQIPNINISKKSLLEYFEFLKTQSEEPRILSNETPDELFNEENHKIS